MKKNRIVPRKMSVTTANSMFCAAVIFMLLLMVIVNHLASSSCTQLQKSIGNKKAELAKLENERLRENADWMKMITAENLNATLLKHGMKMQPPSPTTQIIRMGRNGRPVPGQVSLAKAQERKASAASRTAQYTTGRRTVKR